MKKAQLSLIAIIALVSGFIASWMLYDSKPVKLETAMWFGNQAKSLPDFRLNDHNNQAFGNPQLTDKWSLLFFGYTHCPDICPTSLQVLSNLLNSMDGIDSSRAIQVIFVSVDPDRDTPANLKSYVEYFHPDIIGASASVSELNLLTKAVGIAHNRNKPVENQVSYEVSHSSGIILINPDGEFAGLFGAPHDAFTMTSDMKKIIKYY